MSKTLCDITHNCRIKSYPDGSREIMCADAPIFRESGWELSDKWDREPRPQVVAIDPSGNLDRAKRRARSAVADIALSNDFRYFVTLTLDGSKVNRYDPAEVTRRLNGWLDNHVRRDGLAYVLVPELHKDGAIHFHGFFNGALAAVDSGTLDTGTGKPKKPRSAAQRAQWLSDGAHVVYNLPAWTLGFTTAIELYGTRRAAVGYVCKYVTKAQTKVGGRWYYSGGALQRPAVEVCDLEFSGLSDVYPGHSFEIDGLGCHVVKFTVGGDDSVTG